MNLTKAICDHGPNALAEIDQRISAILRELSELQVKRVNIVMHLNIEEAMGGLTAVLSMQNSAEGAGHD
jgi:hypothetical protein